VNELGPDLRALLEPFGTILSVEPLRGGRHDGTVVVDHDGGTRAVVHRRSGGAASVEAEVRATVRAHAAAVGPEVLAASPVHGLFVTRWVDGVPATAEDLSDPAVLSAVGSAVRSLHDAPVDLALPAMPVLDPLRARRDYLEAAAERAMIWPDGVLAEERGVDAIAASLDAGPTPPPVGVHGDLVPANVLVAGADVVLLDHEYAGLADPAFDLGGLAATAELDGVSVGALVAAYNTAGAAAGALDPARVLAWRRVIRHAWFVWVALGDGLGSESEVWVAWAERARIAWEHESGQSQT